jgi:solute:Na+ symporter, SSS family
MDLSFIRRVTFANLNAIHCFAQRKYCLPQNHGIKRRTHFYYEHAAPELELTALTPTIWFALAAFSFLYVAWLIVHLARHRHDGAEGTLAEFFVSSRDVGFWTALATLGATEIGLITIAYNAQKGFGDGFSAFHIGIAALIGAAFVGLTGFIVKPLRRTGVLTVPEFYGQRYGQDVRVFGAVVMAAGGILNMGLFLKVASLFILNLLGIEAGHSGVIILMLALIVLAVAYTCYGGMRAVIATDVAQFILMVAGLGLALSFALGQISLSEAVAIVEAEKGRAGFDPVVNESFGPLYIMWMVLVAGIVSSAVWPTALSRSLCIRDDRTVKRAYLAASIVFMGRMILPAMLGVLAFCYFTQQGGNGAATFGDTSNSSLVATPQMLGAVLPPWLVVFLAVAAFASFMSTQDGYLFCWSSVIARDIVGPLTGRTEDAPFQIQMTRAAIVAIALYEVYWGLVYAGTEDIWDYLAVSGSIYFCSGIVLLAGGLYWPRATRRGALAALVLGFSAIAALEPVKKALGLDAWSAPEIGFAAIGLSLAGFVLGSLTEQPPTKHSGAGPA